MMKAVQLLKYGGVENLQLAEIATPEISENELLVKTIYTGLNFIEVYYRKGMYPLPSLPAVIGSEALGMVVSIGKNVTKVKMGDMVACVRSQSGTYAEYFKLNEDQTVIVPSFIEKEVAISMMLQGLTVHYLTKNCFSVQKGTTVLIHAGAGGVGQIFIQVAKHLGAYVITTVSNDAKSDIAKKLGADLVINYTDEDFKEVVMKETKGIGVDVVYDSIGETTFDKSMQCVKKRGALICFGQSSGKVPPVDIGRLSAQGSITLCRPTLAHYTDTWKELNERSHDVFHWVKSGVVKLQNPLILPYSEIPTGQTLLETKKTTGKVLFKWN